MRRLRVAVITHEELVPPDSIEGLSDEEIAPFKREWGVVKGLRDRKHDVRVIGVSDDLLPIRTLIEAWKPHIFFNLLLEFHDVAAYQIHVLSYLELLKMPYTGCNPRGLLLGLDKSLHKQILRYHRIATASFSVFRRGKRVRRPRQLEFPIIVKSVDEDASFGVSQASVVRNEDQLRERVDFVHRHARTDALAEEYIEGRELTISVLGNHRLEVFPMRELRFSNLPEGSLPIATEKAKWDLDYQKRVGLEVDLAEDLPPGLEERTERMARRIYRLLGLSGYARLDLRLREDGRVFVIEVNPNPDITYDEDFAESAWSAGRDYPDLLDRILRLGLRYDWAWKRQG